MTLLFSIEGIENEQTVSNITVDLEKIVGVDEVFFDLKKKELKVHLDRQNGIISKLIEHVIQKEDSSIVLTELEKNLDD